jgi:hypothetical protein
MATTIHAKTALQKTKTVFSKKLAAEQDSAAFSFPKKLQKTFILNVFYTKYSKIYLTKCIFSVY